MSILINLEDFEVNVPYTSFGIKGRVRVRRLMTEPFIKGPVPLRWLVEAANLGPDALVVGLILWYKNGMKKQPSFRMGQGEIAKLLHVSRRTVLRGIKRLERKGLIMILRAPGQKLIVTITQAPPDSK
jgi:DNA-binding MarR family transcriptional regulator